MEPIIAAAARSLATGNPLHALNLIALSNEAPALALRGIAIAQLGDLDQARVLLRRAGNAFGPQDGISRVRCVVAEAEIAFVSRDLGWPVKALAEACAILEAHGDFLNAAHARHLEARRYLIMGRLEDAEKSLGVVDPLLLHPPRRAAHEMIVAGIAMRRLRTAEARAAFSRAMEAATRSGIAALRVEVDRAVRLLNIPVARQITFGEARPVLLEEVESLTRSGAFIVDSCRRVVRFGRVVVPLATRPVLFSIARILAEAWPLDVSREELIRHAFQAKAVNEAHRARLRVEVGRLRKLLKAMADVRSTQQGFAIRPKGGAKVNVLAWPVDEDHAEVLAFLADGESWSTSSLALVLGVSQRTVQRSLEALATADRVQCFGRGRARRWTTSALPGFTTILLLPVPESIG